MKKINGDPDMDDDDFDEENLKELNEGDQEED